MTTLQRRSLLIGSAAATPGAPAIVRAQGDWPKGPIKIIVPFPPGGSTDPVARLIQAKLIENTGWNIIVDNKPGGTGVVGSAVAAKSPPDGQTWMITFDSHILNPASRPACPTRTRTAERHADRPHPAGHRRASRPALQDLRRGGRGCEEAAGQGQHGVLGASQALVLMTLIKKENERRHQPDPYKGGGPLNQDILAGVTDTAIGSTASLSRISAPTRSGRSASPARSARLPCPTRRR
jgi:tripartite-type tricarboxylate transporter receptor subunit TctC